MRSVYLCNGIPTYDCGTGYVDRNTAYVSMGTRGVASDPMSVQVFRTMASAFDPIPVTGPWLRSMLSLALNLCALAV